MKQFILSILIIFISASGAFAMPDNLYDENNQKPIIYDASYNIALRKKLEADYDKKYLHVNKDGTYGYYDTPLNSYEKEVVIPYALNKKRWQDTIITK